MQEYFVELADVLTSLLRGNEIYTCSFAAEDSDFVRLNRSAIRQAGSVSQRTLSCDLIDGQRHASGQLALSGDLDLDRSRLTGFVAQLREQLPSLPEDPHLLYATEVRSSEYLGDNHLPEDSGAIVSAVLDAGHGHDLVGIYAAGGIYRGFANSFGQRNWFSTYTYNLDWSLYVQADKAVKSRYAGFVWDPAEFSRRMDAAQAQLAGLSRPARTIEPGEYRVYLAPTALVEIVELLSWAGFGLKDHRTKQTTLLKMVEEGQRLSPQITLLENTADGVAANFQDAGFLKPDRVPLIEAGAFGECLVSPRSAKEYGVPTNGASGWEMPASLDLAAGTIPDSDILRRLDRRRVHQQPVVSQLFRPDRVSHDRHDPLCHLLGRARRTPGSAQRHAL